MAVATGARDLAAQARRWDEEARRHKRASQHHREMARRCRERQAEIEAECRRLGITVTYTREGNHHGGSTKRREVG